MRQGTGSCRQIQARPVACSARSRASQTRRRSSDTGPLRSARVSLVALVTAAAAVAVFGGVRITHSMLWPAPVVVSLSGLTGPGPFVVGQAVRTDSAVIDVTGVALLNGLTAKDLSSANHGISHLVAANQVQVQVTLRLTNDTGAAFTYAPSQIRLRIGGKASTKALSSTLPDGPLRPGVSLEGTVGFVAARDASKLELELPRTGGPVLIDLGTTDKSSAPGGAGTHHH
jgi:hypothetical protein